MDGDYVKAEFAVISDELGTKPFGDMTVTELLPYRARIEKAIQKDVYVQFCNDVNDTVWFRPIQEW